MADTEIPPAGPQKFFDTSQPFALPEGSIRALLALMVIGMDLFMQCWFRWSPPSMDTMASMAFAYYFAQATTRQNGAK